MRIDANYRSDHVLSDGTRVSLRMIRPDDRDELRRGFERLSERSKYRRFMITAQRFTDEMARYLSEVDGVHHVAIVASTDSHDLKSERGIGVARFIQLKDEPGVAEAAVAVADEMQGRGVGRLLLRTLAEAARERGVHSFRAEVLTSNAPIRHILEEDGGVAKSDHGETIVYDVSIEPSLLARLFRRVVAALALFHPSPGSAALGSSPEQSDDPIPQRRR